MAIEDGAHRAAGAAVADDDRSHPRSLIGYIVVWMGVLTAANLIVVIVYTVVARLFGGTAAHGP